MSKKTLALRLADLVLYREYGIGDNSAFAPVARKAVRRENRVRVDFDHAGGLRTRDGKPVSHLELAGKDGKFHPAAGTLSANGASLEASAPEVKTPVKIRFGFDQLADPNLVNRAGVPAAPFELEIR
jgi:sialate O-acetylesterase